MGDGERGESGGDGNQVTGTPIGLLSVSIASNRRRAGAFTRTGSSGATTGATTGTR